MTLKALGFTYLEESKSLSSDQKAFARENPKMRKLYQILTDDEVGQLVMEAVNEIRNPVRIEFEDKECTACGETNDPRLMSRKGLGRMTSFH